VLLFFKEPRRAGEIQATSLAETARNLFIVLTNPRFMVFLLIFSGYWIVYWQAFIVLPLYVHGYIDARADVELLLVTGPATVICLQFLMTYITQKIPTFSAITLGTLVSAVSWLIVAFRPAVWAAVASIFVLALGEIILSPRYYEYVSRLAPPGQQGTYMGFAFVPIGIGSFVGGWLGGRLMHHFGEVVQRPAHVWWAISGIGIGTTLLMWLYHLVVKTDLPT
jgi:MFS family permease